LFIIGVSIFFPKMCPALPVQARTIRETGKRRGAPSLLILLAISAAAAMTFAKGFYPKDAPLDELIVSAMLIAVGVSFGLAVLNRALKLNLLSNMAEKVVFVLIPPL